MSTATAVITILCLSISISAKTFPSLIEKCSRSDPELGKCLEKRIEEGLRIFKDGNKEMGLNKFEPFYVPKLDLGNSSGGSVSLHQQYENVYIHGMSTTKISDFMMKFSDSECFWSFKGFVPNLRMESDYNIDGKVLLFKINSQGTCNNTLIDLDVKHDMKCESYTKHGKKYYRILEYKFDMQPKKVLYAFKDTTKDNIELKREVLKTINDNALEVYADVKGGFEESFAYIYKEVLNNFFSRFAVEEMFDP